MDSKERHEIESAATSGDLPETPSFDAKADLPQAKKNADLAIDVAAMATDGGLLLYGVAEDETRRPTVPNPIPLPGAADRIGQTVATSISEVPYIDVREFPSEEDSSMGYIAVVVPPSPRAPHQVTVGDDLRFYGRGATGNRRLTEGEVARLYERRQAWAVDAEQLLREVIQGSEIPPQDGVGYLHAFTRPIPPDQGMFERAIERLGGASQLHQRLLEAVRKTKLAATYDPSLRQAHYFERRGADEWRLSSKAEAERSDLHTVRYLSELRINIDGRGQLFCGRATDHVQPGSAPAIIEAVIAGNLEAFLAAMGTFYDAADYLGALDVGVAVTGIRGARSLVRSQRTFAVVPDQFTYSADTFARTARVAAAELGGPDEVAHRLLRHFYEATTGQEGWNPFDPGE